jgi:murein DD-endopeptidase MepM/ murein hydrolase activator NlpD
LDLSGAFLDQDQSFVAGKGRYFALVGVGVSTEAGDHPLLITAVERDTGDRLTIQAQVSIVPGVFSRTNVQIPADRQGLLDPALSQAESNKVSQVFGQVSGWQQWQGVFRPPVDGELPISAGFGQLRSYNSASATSYHAGEDIDVDLGTPVLAPADGTVVLAEELQVRGNAIIIDHGLGVFTGFWHLSEIKVQVGQQVKASELVGRVGNTGLSTGAHLHWEMRVRGVPVSPLQWTQQEFP